MGTGGAEADNAPSAARAGSLPAGGRTLPKLWGSVCVVTKRFENGMITRCTRDRSPRVSRFRKFMTHLWGVRRLLGVGCLSIWSANDPLRTASWRLRSTALSAFVSHFF